MVHGRPLQPTDYYTIIPQTINLNKVGNNDAEIILVKSYWLFYFLWGGLWLGLGLGLGLHVG